MPTEPTPADYVLFADGLILAEELEVLTVAGFLIGHEGAQPMVALRFAGRVNKTEERREVHIALSPKDALALIDTIVESVTAAFPQRGTFGQQS